MPWEIEVPGLYMLTYIFSLSFPSWICMLQIMCSMDPWLSNYLEPLLQIKYFSNSAFPWCRKKLLKTGINQAAWCSEQMGFPAPLRHLCAQAAHSASQSHSSLLSLRTCLWEHMLAVGRFWLCFFWVCRSHHTTCVDFHWEGHDQSSQHRAVTSSMSVKGRKEPFCDRSPVAGW